MQMKTRAPLVRCGAKPLSNPQEHKGLKDPTTLKP